MGDQHELKIKCGDCGELHAYYYAESSGRIGFICKKCKKLNLISRKLVMQAIKKIIDTLPTIRDWGQKK
ncbi:MAG: hypothetical protein A2W47_04315 [Gammaproteobacteria bacterium RIFCSPHIGHO2_12_38_15]|nr:MAG: hypothetical protein A2W47_04315 [Gammaproteobacteria bacterium RIFCSPHIGHO2_12_38_15]